MKNIHVLPTEKPSPLMIEDGKLFYSKSFGFNKFNETINFRHINNQNIYITSDEEIKEGDWVFDNDANQAVAYKYLRVNPNLPNFPYYKKIILTTDQQLIDDGVQTIDDEFLEWFVKNPSCEEVDVKKRV
jgi:hypothetical protein